MGLPRKLSVGVFCNASVKYNCEDFKKLTHVYSRTTSIVIQFLKKKRKEKEVAVILFYKQKTRRIDHEINRQTNTSTHPQKHTHTHVHRTFKLSCTLSVSFKF